MMNINGAAVWDMDDRMDAFVTACKQNGLRLTHQRLEIYRELMAAKDHPSAEMVYTRVRKRIPTISLDTVYRTLGSLEECNIIGRVGASTSSARFESNPFPHDHFICDGCGEIRDVYASELNREALVRAVPEAYVVRSSHVELRGFCPACGQDGGSA
ncbi:MAG: hypothetical protein AMXMBFR82_48610 [Candidatus Hydrogenedentota bacterium]